MGVSYSEEQCKPLHPGNVSVTGNLDCLGSDLNRRAAARARDHSGDPPRKTCVVLSCPAMCGTADRDGNARDPGRRPGITARNLYSDEDSERSAKEVRQELPATVRGA